jgi:MFS family permease
VIAAGAVGTLIGSMSVRWIERRVTFGRAVVWLMFLGTWPFLLVPLASHRGTTSLLVLVTAFLAAGMGIGAVVVFVATLRQTVTPARMMGRMNATYRFVVFGSITLGALLGGALGTAIGLHPTIVIGALGIAIAPAWIVVSPIGRLRTAQEASAPAASPADR